MKPGEYKGGVPKTPQDLTAIRIRMAFYGLRAYCVTPANLKLHDQFVSCISTSLPADCALLTARRNFDRHGTKISTMFAHMHDAVTGLWFYCRKNELPPDLEAVMVLLERIGKEGLAACQMEGNLATGYALVFPKVLPETTKAEPAKE